MLHFIYYCVAYCNGGIRTTSKPMRISDEAERIALGHGSTVSKGIVEMNFKISQVPSAKEKFQSTPVPQFDNVYWEKLKLIVEEAIKKYAGGY